MGLDRLSLKDRRKNKTKTKQNETKTKQNKKKHLAILTQCPHNFGPKFGLLPNDPIFFNFSLTRCPWVRKQVPCTYIDFIYKCSPPPCELAVAAPEFFVGGHRGGKMRF